MRVTLLGRYGLVLGVLGALPISVGAQVGLVTWLHPQSDGRLAVESAHPGVEVRVHGTAGAEIADVGCLRVAGWEPASGGFWQSPKRAGGGKLAIRTSGLPPGTHQVYLRYFSQPRQPPNPWWFAIQAGVDGGTTAKGWLDQNAERIVAGTGGHDPSTVYESRIGSVGSEEQPAAGVALWVQRYEWSELARIGSVRIETDPSMHYCDTGAATPANERIRGQLLANGPKADGQPAYGVAVLSGTLKVRPKSFAALEGQPLPAQVDIAAARGEYENRQVVVYNPDRDLNRVTLACTALTGEAGAVIPESEILFAPLGYCPYRLPSDLAVHGYWPEPILPFLKEFRVKRGDVQSLWYRVHVPREAKAGVYRGTLTVRPSEAPACTLPVTLRVWDLTRPQWPRLRVVVGCNQVGEFELSYGLNPSTIYGFDEAWIGEFPQWAAAGATAVNLGYIWGQQIDQQTKLPSAAQLDEWVAQVRRRYQAAAAAGLRDACYLYLFDEATAEWDPAMSRVSQRLRREFPELLLLTTAHRGWYPGATVKDGGETIADINAWCPLTNHYTLEAAAAARAHGRQVWWYTCNSPEKPFANILMTHPALDARLLMGFMAFAYETDGFLYYATAGGNWANTPAIAGGPYTDWPIVDNAHDHLYQKGPDGPLPSLRLEAIRDGLEDYDLLHAAAGFRSALRQRGAESADLARLDAGVAPLFAPGNVIVRSLTEYTEDPNALEARRRLLAEYCLAAQRVLEPASRGR